VFITYKVYKQCGKVIKNQRGKKEGITHY